MVAYVGWLTEVEVLFEGLALSTSVGIRRIVRIGVTHVGCHRAAGPFLIAKVMTAFGAGWALVCARFGLTRHVYCNTRVGRHRKYESHRSFSQGCGRDTQVNSAAYSVRRSVCVFGARFRFLALGI